MAEHEKLNHLTLARRILWCLVSYDEDCGSAVMETAVQLVATMQVTRFCFFGIYQLRAAWGGCLTSLTITPALQRFMFGRVTRNYSIAFIIIHSTR
jgi:hypothetical protein